MWHQQQWHGMKNEMRHNWRGMHPHHHGGWGHGRGHLGGKWWVFPLLLFIVFASAGKAWWVFFFVFPFLMWFVFPMLGKWMNSEAWDGSWSSSGEAEKRKRDEFLSADEKPKRHPVYVVGDDGELIEVPDDQPTPKKRDDGIRYV